MKNQESNETHDHVKEELSKEKRISRYQIISIIILIILCILLAYFSEDESVIVVSIKKIFNKVESLLSVVILTYR